MWSVFHENICCGRTCLVGVHVLQMACSVLLEDLCYWMTCFTCLLLHERHVQHEVRFYRMACYAGEHVLLEGMLCCGLVFHENVCCGRTCLVALQVLHCPS